MKHFTLMCTKFSKTRNISLSLKQLHSQSIDQYNNTISNLQPAQLTEKNAF